MALKSDLNGIMLGWQDKCFKGTPTVPQIKRAWSENRFAMVVYLAGLKKGMEAAYEAIRAVWADVQKGDYEIGHDQAEGRWYVNRLQDEGIWAFQDSIPTVSRPAVEYWNKGRLWEGIYLAGVRRGWIIVRDYLFQGFTQVWVENHGFPD
ncbi:MAG: hypothetical protein PHC52_00550 [Syntrophales bacterium]|nr:hypothetical protein [Syntrophales bacterium]